MNDAALTRLFLRFRDRRNGRALAAVFDATARELIDVAAHLVRDVDEAEDLVQTTFRVAIERAESFDGDRSLRAWLYGILAKEAARSRRRAARRVERGDLCERAEAGPLESLIAEEIPAVLRDAVARLPAPYREVVGPVVCGGRSPGEVARELGRAPGTVRVQVQRGLEKLRRLLPEGYGAAALVGSAAGGLEALRDSVLRKAGFSKAAAPHGVAVAVEAARAVVSVTPALWVAPAVMAGLGALWIAEPSTVPAALESPSAVTGEHAPERADATEAPGAIGATSSRRAANLTPQGRAPVRPVYEHPAAPQVVGKVVDERGRPAPDVLVRGKRDADPGFVARFRTDAVGRFSFDGLAEGWWFFSVDDPDHALVWWRKYGVEVAAADADETEPSELRIALYDPRSLGGLVVDELGQPVANARVTLAVERVEGEQRPVQGKLTSAVQVANSDSEGRFVLQRLSPGELTFVLDHPAYARSLAYASTEDGLARLVLRKGLALRGRVLDGSRPLAHVRILGRASCLGSLSMGDRSATTDAEGRFVMERVHSPQDWAEAGMPGITLRLDDPDWVSAGYRVHQWEGDRLPSLTLAAFPAGTEVDPARVDIGRDLAREAEANGEPFGTARIRVRFAGPPAPAVWIAGRSPALEGFYRNERVEGESIEFAALAPGSYRVWTLNGGGANFVPATVELAEGEPADVLLRPGAVTLRGMIRRGTEQALVNRVFLRGPMRARADLAADGTYAVHGIVPGEYTLSVSAKGHFDNHFQVLVADDGGGGSGEARFDITLPVGSIRGVLRGVEEFDPEDRRLIKVFPRGWGPSSGNRGAFARVDADGRFELGSLPEGDYNVWARAVPRVRPVAVHITRAAPGHDIVLAPPATVASVTGRITNPVDPSGFFAASVALIRRDTLGYDFSQYGGFATIEADGSFRVKGVEPGGYGLLVQNTGLDAATIWQPGLVVPPAGLDGLVLTQPESRAVRIRLEPGAEPVSQRIWHVVMPAGDRIPFYTFIGSEPTGRIAGESEFHLALGSYTVEADFGAGQLVTRALSVEPGEGVLELVVALE